MKNIFFAGRSLWVHSVCMLQHVMSFILVEWWQVFGPCCPYASVPMDHWLQGRKRKGSLGQASRSLLGVPLSHNYELYQDMPQGIEFFGMVTILYICIIGANYLRNDYFSFKRVWILAKLLLKSRNFWLVLRRRTNPRSLPYLHKEVEHFLYFVELE